MTKKPVGDRTALIKWRLKNMIAFAKEMQKPLWDESLAATNDKYIRILGESCRAVSLNDLSPLCGYGGTGSKVVSNVIKHFDDAKREPIKLAGDDWKKKKERRLQSWIIKQGLMNGRDLLQSPIFNCLKTHFDELLFALDEVSFGDNNHNLPKIVRCDLLAVGVKGNNVFPVVIELKSNRALGDLIMQLANAEKEIDSHSNEIGELMKSLTKKNISDFAVRKVLVWPAATIGESKGTAEIRTNSDVIFVEYSPKDFKHPEEMVFSLPLEVGLTVSTTKQ